MNSNPEGSEAEPTHAPASPRRKLVDTIIWVVIPVGLTLVLAVKYWPR